MPARSVPVSPTFVTASEHEVWLRAGRQLDGCTLLAIPYYYSDAIVSTVLITAIAIFDPRISGALRKLLPAGREKTA